jgi:hypothetical protein
VRTDERTRRRRRSRGSSSDQTARMRPRCSTSPRGSCASAAPTTTRSVAAPTSSDPSPFGGDTMELRPTQVPTRTLLVTFASAMVLGACATRAAHDRVEPTDRSGVSLATVDTVAARLAALELNRLATRAAGMGATPMGQEVDQWICVLRELLQELPDPVPADRAVTQHVLRTRCATSGTVGESTTALGDLRGGTRNHPAACG